MQLLRAILIVIFTIPVAIIKLISDISRWFCIRFWCLLLELCRDMEDEEGINQIVEMCVKAIGISEREKRELAQAMGTKSHTET